MKFTTVLLILFMFLSVVSCTKEPQPQQTNIDSLNTGDSMVSGNAQITPDTGDDTLPMDSTSYDVDSIKNSR